MKPQELAHSIQQQGVAPLYLVCGEEDCLRDQAVATIKAAALGHGSQKNGGDDGLEAFAYDLLYGDECDASEILGCAREASVFAPCRLLIVKAAEKLPAREGEALLPYLKAPCDSTTLVFVAAKLDGRLKFSQALSKQAVVVECSSLYDNQLPAWIRAEASRVGVRLNEEAIHQMADLAASLRNQAGGSLYLIRRELEKLAAYVPAGAVAGPADVESVRGGEAGASVFDLTAAIGAQDPGLVLGILARNLEAGEAPVRILGSLVWQYRQLWKAKELLRQGRGEADAARLLRMQSFKVKEFVGRFPESHLREGFRLFVETDSRLKGGSATTPALVLESLLLTLCWLGKESGLKAGGLAAAGRPGPSRPAGARPATAVPNQGPVRTGGPSTG